MERPYYLKSRFGKAKEVARTRRELEILRKRYQEHYGLEGELEYDHLAKDPARGTIPAVIEDAMSLLIKGNPRKILRKTKRFIEEFEWANRIIAESHLGVCCGGSEIYPSSPFKRF